MKLKKGRRQCQDILVVLVLLQHSPTMRQGELALIGDAGDGWCVFPHSYHRVQDKASPPPGPLALPGVHFCVADLMLSLSPFCADEATCISGTGQLLQGWWLSTPSLGASLSVLGFRNPTEQAVGKQQSAGNRGQSHGLGACVPSAVALGSISCCWCLLLPPQAGHVGVVAATPLPHPPHAFPCPCSQPEARLQAGKHGSVTCPVWGSWMDTPATHHLERWHGWSPVGLWSGALRRNLGEVVHQFMLPMETPAWGISKIPSLSKAEASPSWFPKAIQDAGAFPNPSKGWEEGHWWPEHAPWVQWPAGVFKGGSSHTQQGEEPGLFLA